MADPLDAALADMDERLEPEDAPEEGTPSEPEQTELADEPEQVEAPEPDEPAEPADLLAGKYQTPEDLASAYKSLEQKLGEQGRELAEYRRMLEAQPEYEPPAPQTQINQPVVDWFEEQVAANPYGAAVWAQQNDPSGILYNRALDSWYDEAPRQAAAFERQQEIERVRQEFGQQMQQTQAPLEAQEMARAFRAASDNHPEIGDNLGELLQTAAQNSPVVTQTLLHTARQSDYATRVQIFDSIISLAKGQQAGAVTQAVQDAADADAARARQLKQAGGVATQTSAAAVESVSADEQWLRDNFDKYLAPE